MLLSLVSLDQYQNSYQQKSCSFQSHSDPQQHCVLVKRVQFVFGRDLGNKFNVSSTEKVIARTRLKPLYSQRFDIHINRRAGAQRYADQPCHWTWLKYVTRRARDALSLNYITWFLKPRLSKNIAHRFNLNCFVSNVWFETSGSLWFEGLASR